MLQSCTAVLHGHRVSYRRAGEGSAVVLLHGIGSNSLTWEPVASALAERHDVIAPDFLGHGASAKPRGDYSLGAFASGVRDLLQLLGVERATIVGHSLGGGVAMQFAYQHPELCERLVLVSSGGLGHERQPAAARRRAARLGVGAAARRRRRRRRSGPRSAACSARVGLRAGQRPGRGRARHGRPRRPRGAPGLPRHAARGRRPGRPARERARPPLPRRRPPAADRVGRARPDHPRRPRAPRARRRARQRDARDRRRRALPAARRPRRLRDRRQPLHRAHASRGPTTPRASAS